MAAPVRYVLAVFAGLVVAFVLILCVEFLAHALYPAPPGTDLSDPEALKTFMAAMPAGAFLLVVLAYVLGTLGGGWVAVRLARARPLLFAGIIGALVLAAAVANVMMIPHPAWFVAASVAAILAAAWLAARLGGVTVPPPDGARA